LNVPNLLSLFRILLVPLLVAVLLTKFDGKEFVGLAVFLVASLTDFLDGFIARRKKLVTRLGKLLDPAADKILTSAAFISLVEMNPEVTPAWMVVVSSAKLKTVMQIVSISLLIFYNQLGEFEHLAPLSLWLAMLASLYSGIEYFVRFAPGLLKRDTSTKA
jgi:CDP-diacylglycerol--glycerol-3-phosphate 3-phosphatidyltransferase